MKYCTCTMLLRLWFCSSYSVYLYSEWLYSTGWLWILTRNRLTSYSNRSTRLDVHSFWSIISVQFYSWIMKLGSMATSTQSIISRYLVISQIFSMAQIDSCTRHLWSWLKIAINPNHEGLNLTSNQTTKTTKNILKMLWWRIFRWWQTALDFRPSGVQAKL